MGLINAITDRLPGWLYDKALPTEAPGIIRDLGTGRGTTVDPPDNPKELLAHYREWVYACVTKNAEGVAAIPLRLYTENRGPSSRASRSARKTPLRSVSKKRRADLEARPHLSKFLRANADIQEVLEHPFLMLWESGNPFLTGSQNQRLIIMHLDIIGDSYMLMDIDPSLGIPTQLFALPPETMSIGVTEDGFGIDHYSQQRPGKNEKVKIPANSVMHCKHPDPKNTLYGMSPLEAIGISAMLYHQYNIFEAALLNNDAVPGTVFRIKSPMTDTQKRREERKWKAKHGGPGKAGKLAFVSGIEGIDRLGYSQREMMFQSGRKLTREDIAGVYNVPIPLLISEGSNLAHDDNAEAHHAKYALRPRLALLEDQINRDIIPKYEDGENLFVAFDNPIPEDRTHNLERAKAMTATAGYVYKNEARKALMLDMDPELDGQLIEPSSSLPSIEYNPERTELAVGSSVQKAKPTVQDEFEKRLKHLFSEQKRDILRWLKSQARGVVKLLASSTMLDAVFDADAWAERFQAELMPLMGVQVGAGAVRGLDRIGSAMNFDIQRPEVSDFIADYTYRFSVSVNSKTQADLRNIFQRAEQEGHTLSEVTTKVEQEFGGMERWRANRIARAETVRAREAGQMEAWKQSGVVQGYYWETTSGDPCQFCLETESKFGKDGMHMTFGQNFYDRGSSVDSGDSSMALNYSDTPHPPLHPNCCPPGTMIYTYAGMIPIEKIKVGDMVLTHRARPGKVTSLMHRKYHGTLVKIGRLRVTPDHPVFTQHGWVLAKHLHCHDDEWRQLPREKYTGLVYNFSVENDESYVADDIIVHNCQCDLVPILIGEE